MAKVSQFYADYAEAIHPDDEEAQDELFEKLCAGEVQPSVEEMQAAIEKHNQQLGSQDEHPH